MSAILEAVRQRAIALWTEEMLLGQGVRVASGPLTVEQAIGNPGGGDFPIQKGRERLMEAGIGEARGQAFTDQPGTFAGTLADVSRMPFESNFHRAVFVAALNASMALLGRAGHTVHCRNEGPGECASGIAAYVKDQYGSPRITQVGFQPALAEALSGVFDLRVLDLDPENVGHVKRGVLVEGEESGEEALEWGELLLITGTTLANGTLDDIIEKSGNGGGGKDILFYGTTIAGAAELMGWKRFCPVSS